MDYDKTIQAMAGAMFDLNSPVAHNWEHVVKGYSHKPAAFMCVPHYRKLAKAALAALQETMPEIKDLRERYDAMGVLSELRPVATVQQEIVELYCALKELGK